MKFKLHATLSNESAFIKDLPLSQVRIILDARYPWCLLIPSINDVTEMSDLNDHDYTQLMKESRALLKAMQICFLPDKMNVASLGNVVSQLHVHHIARYTNDPAWPNPVWGFKEKVAYQQELLNDRMSKIQETLKI